MNVDVKGYSQWFAGKKNNVTDALSQDWHCSNNKLTCILHSYFPKQMPGHFTISPLPSMISLWLISTLQRLPMSKLLREQHTATGLKLGGGGKNTANPTNVMMFTWTGSPGKRESSCWEPLPWLSMRGDICKNAISVWLREQSEAPFHMWCRPSGRMADQTP